MDYEKKYKEALSWIKDVYPTFEGAVKEDAEHFFPELKEPKDEKTRKEIVGYLKRNLRFEWAAWLEKQGEQKPDWSEEDEERIKNILSVLGVQVCWNGATGNKENPYQKEIDWLKSLKPQNRDTYNPYKEVVSSIAEMCDKYKSFSDDRANDFVNNVKVKCKDAKEYDSIYPQNTWKPSIAQLNALSIVSKGNAPDDIEAIVSLYNDLKKLTE